MGKFNVELSNWTLKNLKMGKSKITIKDSQLLDYGENKHIEEFEKNCSCNSIIKNISISIYIKMRILYKSLYN